MTQFSPHSCKNSTKRNFPSKKTVCEFPTKNASQSRVHQQHSIGSFPFIGTRRCCVYISRNGMFD